MATLKNLKPGQVLYEVDKSYRGASVSFFEIKVTEVHDNHVVASWNGNAPRRYSEPRVKRWRVKKPS